MNVHPLYVASSASVGGTYPSSAGKMVSNSILTLRGVLSRSISRYKLEARVRSWSANSARLSLA